MAPGELAGWAVNVTASIQVMTTLVSAEQLVAMAGALPMGAARGPAGLAAAGRGPPIAGPTSCIKVSNNSAALLRMVAASAALPLSCSGWVLVSGAGTVFIY